MSNILVGYNIVRDNITKFFSCLLNYQVKD